MSENQEISLKKMEKDDNANNVLSSEQEPNTNDIIQTDGKRNILKDLHGDKIHVCVLFCLYILQGIPLGLGSAVPLVLINRSVPYKDQAKFSFAGYPFSMKLLWAPLVDSVYVARFGRRKSWLVPTQYLLGITMLVASQYVSRLLGDSEDPKENLEPDVSSLTAMFFFLNFLAATQDVAVDGWALTMLKPSNVGYASTCNSVGQTVGWCLGFIVYTTLESYGLVTLSDFLLFWGIVFLLTTSGIALFMKEKNTENVVGPVTEKLSDIESEPDLGLIETYKILWKIVRHPIMPVVIVLLLTCNFGFSAAESITNLKLIEKGVPKEKIAMLALPMIPVKILFTLFITRYTVGPRPMNVWLASFPFRLLLCLAMVLLVYITPLLKLEEGGFPTFYYVIVIGVFAIHRIALYAMFVAIMAFFARISDPAVGGTYMTFLNTLSNLGGMWPASFVLWFVDLITYKTCKLPSAESASPLATSTNTSILHYIEANQCYGTSQVEGCKDAGAECDTITDGFYTLSVVCVGIGAILFVWVWRTVRALQEVDITKWRVVKTDEIEEVKQEKKEQTKTFKFFYCF